MSSPCLRTLIVRCSFCFQLAMGMCMVWRSFFRRGFDVNSINLDGRTVLYIAAWEEHWEVVRLLVRWRANIDARYRWGSTLQSLINKIITNFTCIHSIMDRQARIFKETSRFVLPSRFCR
ncbi:putative ankyrin repeat protein RBE_0921 isoform X1 [Dioscorea cayenensis subsp. rotundata]|uniref:Ankyrin repeat protein RBE_0921 isoform X1 n=1 Tax=Dioscorea cayennensis subsp. rotundata TaxID=55577 RepID=A0AB40BXV7_DIOCR|nr:putative ankyrin repeat protein RBE_0921 isoform X1 [Dioscorea cayenensis subsp. rotundata]